MPKTELLPLSFLLNKSYPDGKEERLVGKYRNIDSGYFDILRFFGEKAVNPIEIKIKYTTDDFSFKDNLLANFAAEIASSLREEGRLYDGPPVTKLVSHAKTDNKVDFIIQSAAYEQFAGSCFLLDCVHPLFENYGGTLRSYELANGHLGQKTVEMNQLAICFGISAMILVRDNNDIYLLRTLRSRNLATLTGSIGGSVAGVIDFCKHIQNLEQLALKSLKQELSEEVNLSISECKIILLAYAREIMRGEHPQLFCLVIADISKNEIISKLENIEIEHREFDWYDFIPLNSDKTIDPGKVNDFNFEGQMNYYLMEEYLGLL